MRKTLLPLIILAVVLAFVLVAGCSRCVPKVDFNKCLEAEDNRTFNKCIEIALDGVDCLETCLLVNQTGVRDKCVYTLAQRKDNRIYCNHLRNESLKNLCENQLS